MTKEIGYAVSKGALHQATLTLSEELIAARDHGQHHQSRPEPTPVGVSRDVDPKSAMPQGRWGEPDDAARLDRVALHERRAVDHGTGD